MEKEFEFLKTVVSVLWNIRGGDISYGRFKHKFSHKIAFNLQLEMEHFDLEKRIQIKLTRLDFPVGQKTVMPIYLQPKYRVVKGGKVIYHHLEFWDTLNFIICGLRERVKWAEKTAQPGFRSNYVSESPF